MNLLIDNKEYNVIIFRKKKKNISIKVDENLNILVYSNKFTPDNEIKIIINKNINKIKKMITSIEKKNTLTFLGKEINVVEVSNLKEPEIDNNRLYINSKLKIEEFYKNLGYEIFKERLDLIFSKFEDIEYPILKVRKMKTRWGVCNRRNKSITLNSELLKKEIKYIDYVIVHELCHYFHFDHSKKFWNKVENYIPDYKILKKQMRELWI